MKLIRYISIFTLTIALLYLAVTLMASSILDRQKNRVQQKAPYPVSEQAREMYNSLDFIADLHCDALLWNRDLGQRSDYGHVDFPRMEEARVALQAFTIVTKSPKGQNFQHNESDAFDNITLLSILQGKPLSNWYSLFNRAIDQCQELHEYGGIYKNPFFIIKSNKGFRDFLERRKKDKSLIAGFIGIEGAHCLEGELENLDRLHEAGVRMIGLTHFFDNELGGSAHGISGAGLTPFGKKVIQRMNELGILIDLAHLSSKMIDDILDMTDQPVLVSHTGVQGTAPSPRNLSDEQVLRIAKQGGLIGIAYFDEAIGSDGVIGIVRAMKYLKDFVGIQHVALGSDFDGSILAPFDILGLPLIVEEMLRQNFTQAEIKAIMGENVRRFLLDHLK